MPVVLVEVQLEQQQEAAAVEVVVQVVQCEHLGQLVVQVVQVM